MTTTHVQDTASSGIATDSSTGSTISVLVPEDATVRTTTLSLDVTSPTGAVIDLTIGSSASQTFAPGSHTVCLSPSMIAYMNMVQRLTPIHKLVDSGVWWNLISTQLDMLC